MEMENKDTVARSSEEIQDIIDRMPSKTGRIVVIIVIILAGLLLLFGFMIEYPEKVTGPVTITARQAPIRLVANSSGKLKLLRSNSDTIRESEIIGCIENPAKLEDILKIEDYLIKIHPDSLFISPCFNDTLASISLGDLSSLYFNFLNGLEKVGQYQNGKPFEKRFKSLGLLLKSQLKLQSYNQKQLNTKMNTLNLARKSIIRDSALFKSSAIAEQDIDRSSITYYGVLQLTQEMEEENTSLKMQIDDTRHRIEMLKLEQVEAEQKHRMDLIAGYNELLAGIMRWKLTYTFSSPFKGTLEYLNFWRENDFVAVGTAVFSVLPADNPILGQVYLPSQGAGKVKTGQEVIIKLNNYPYIEYGSITGTVKTISGVTNQTNESGGQSINTYLILIDLPELLTTNYGVKLDFRYEIRGVADILIKKRKLVERLFDNLKYIASKK